MSISRRNALSMLGIGTGAIVSGEALSKSLHPSGSPGEGFRFGVDQNRTAAALRRLADDIEARGTLLQSMILSSKVGLEDFLAHTLTIEFVLNEIDPQRPAS